MERERSGRRPRDRFGRPLPPGSADELGRLPTAGGAAHERVAEAVRLFDARRFFEAHELFEAVWKSPECVEAHRPLWKAVTQIAVGCCHAQRGNSRGAIAVLARGALGLEQAPPAVTTITAEALAAAARALAATIRSDGVLGKLEFPTIGATRSPPSSRQ